MQLEQDVGHQWPPSHSPLRKSKIAGSDVSLHPFSPTSPDHTDEIKHATFMSGFNVLLWTDSAVSPRDFSVSKPSAENVETFPLMSLKRHANFLLSLWKVVSPEHCGSAPRLRFESRPVGSVAPFYLPCQSVTRWHETSHSGEGLLCFIQLPTPSLFHSFPRFLSTVLCSDMRGSWRTPAPSRVLQR